MVGSSVSSRDECGLDQVAGAANHAFGPEQRQAILDTTALLHHDALADTARPPSRSGLAGGAGQRAIGERGGNRPRLSRTPKRPPLGLTIRPGPPRRERPRSRSKPQARSLGEPQVS